MNTVFKKLCVMFVLIVVLASCSSEKKHPDYERMEGKVERSKEHPGWHGRTQARHMV